MTFAEIESELRLKKSTVGGFPAYKVFFENIALASICSYEKKIVHNELIDAVRNGIMKGQLIAANQCIDGLAAWIKLRRKEIIDPDNEGITESERFENCDLDEGDQAALQILDELYGYFIEGQKE